MGVATGATGVWAAVATATKARTAAEACILKVGLVCWVLLEEKSRKRIRSELFKRVLV
jgi:hypothetical protein